MEINRGAETNEKDLRGQKLTFQRINQQKQCNTYLQNILKTFMEVILKFY